MDKKIKVLYNDNKLNISAKFRKGDKETLFFIHGMGGSKENFEGALKFPKNDFSIVTFDLLGFGDSSKPREFPYSMEAHANICQDLIEKLNLKKVHVIGHSMGGAVALLLIEKIKPKIKSFINLEGNLIKEDCTFSWEATKYSFEEFNKKIFKDFKKEIQKTKDLASSKPLSHELFYQSLLKSDPYAFYKSSQSLVEHSSSGKLLEKFLNLGIKRYYVYGETNREFPTVKLLKSKKVPFLEISSSGHYMMLDNPEEFYPSLFSLLSPHNQ